MESQIDQWYAGKQDSPILRCLIFEQHAHVHYGTDANSGPKTVWDLSLMDNFFDFQITIFIHEGVYWIISTQGLQILLDLGDT